MCCCVKCHKGTHACYLQSPFLYYGTHKICESHEVKCAGAAELKAYIEWARHRQGVCCAVPIFDGHRVQPIPQTFTAFERPILSWTNLIMQCVLVGMCWIIL